MGIMELGAIGELVGGVAVIASLIYVGVQVRQSTATQESQAIQSWYSTRTMIQGLPAQSPQLSAAIAAGAGDSRGLTEDNWVQFGFWCSIVAGSLKVVQELHRKGAISDAIYQTEIRTTAGIILTWPGIRQWWEAGGRSQVPPDLVRTIEATDPGDYVGWNWTPETGFRPQRRKPLRGRD